MQRLCIGNLPSYNGLHFASFALVNNNNLEKSTKYFLNLEKRNYNKKVITKLKTDCGDKITDPVGILNEQENFYKNLYSAETSAFEPGEIEEANLCFTKQMPESVPNDGEIKYCEGEITEKECLDNLKAMPNGKTPGTDGFPAEFYKVFWTD